MRLIRTLIDGRSTLGGAPLRPSEIAEKPRARSDGSDASYAPDASDAPVSAGMRAPKSAGSEPAGSEHAGSEPIERRLAEFKTDLAELTPRRTHMATGPKRKKVWDLDADQLATPQDEVQTLPIEELPEALGQTPLRQTDTSGADTSRPDTQQPENAQPDTEVRHAGNMFEVPNPLAPRRALSGGRVKTRIMGFGAGNPSVDVFDREGDAAAGGLEFPVGWLVVTDGLGRGTFFALQNVVSTIGRGEDQVITLNFGDDTISRTNHAAVAYDDQMNACFLGYGGKANLVRLNGRPVLGTERLTHGDVIRVGQTDLRFVALCGPDFKWDAPDAAGGACDG